jgi:hypothetical protein
MNPKGVNDLDPKLRETYERIMGTTPGVVSGNKTPESIASNQTPHPILETHPEAAAPSAAQSFINPTPSAILEPQIIKPNDPFKETIPPPPEIIMKNAVVGDPGKKKTSLMPFIFVLIVVIFFIVYAVFWAKIFNLL